MASIVTGMEINRSQIKVVRMAKRRHQWQVVACAKEPIPADVLSVYYRRPNIRDRFIFKNTVKRILKPSWHKVSGIGLAVPNEIVKLSIQEFAELPGNDSDIRKMIYWWADKNLRFPVQDAHIQHRILKHPVAEKAQVLMGIAMFRIIREYEDALRELNCDPELIQPSVLSQFNFYSKKIPSVGVQGFIGILEDFFSFFVFDKGVLIFCRVVKRTVMDVHFWQKLDIIWQQYQESHEDKKLQGCYIGSQVELDPDQVVSVQEVTGIEGIQLAPDEIILPVDEATMKSPDQLRQFDAAMGVAMALGG